ncbi:large ribosomal subunit protein uL16-like [Hylobates moloch]|uniref:large ribosomal subunit protein uL16-like n=1 Tax=Hylobates moloch TaxID=81572 RepID=UPI001362A6FB|nr:large ribosomal subunit protein uL16-like [Hylobates moloch]
MKGKKKEERKEEGEKMNGRGDEIDKKEVLIPVCNGCKQQLSWWCTWPVSCMGCSMGPWRQAFQMCVHVSDLALPRYRLQTGIQGGFGKPQGTVARVHIGQVKFICTKLQNKEHVIEALCRAKFKFPGCQKIHISKKWGFTKFNVDECEDMVAEKQLIPDGCTVKDIPNHGPLDKWQVWHW